METRIVRLAILGTAVHVVAFPLAAQQRVAFVKELELGGDQVAPEVSFENITAMRVTGGGDIIVLDSRAPRVVSFSSTGEHNWSFGRRGHGPAELQVPTSLRIGQFIEIYDASLQRLLMVDFKGQYKETIGLRDVAAIGASAIVPVRDSSQVLITTPRFVHRGGGHRPNVLLLHSKGVGPPDTIFRYRSSAMMFFPRDGLAPWGVTETPFGDGGAWTSLGDSALVVVDGITGEVYWWSLSPTARVYQRATLQDRPRPVVENDIAEVLAGVRSKGRALPADISTDTPSHWSVGSRLISDDMGRIWIRIGKDELKGDSWQILDATGAPLRRLRLPAGFELHCVANERAYGVARTRYDSQVVRAYRVMNLL